MEGGKTKSENAQTSQCRRRMALGGVANYEISIMRNGVKSVINLPRVCKHSARKVGRAQMKIGRQRQVARRDERL